MIMLIKRAVLAAVLVAPVAARSDTDAKVAIENFKFGPGTLTITKGTSVTWTNDDDIPHTIVLNALGVRSKTLDTDKAFTYEFDKTGSFTYICGLHPFMKGQVVVK